MNLHEYQAKQLFAEYGLPVSEGVAAETVLEAIAAADVIGGDRWVVKAQVHAGGRGKAGGVKLVTSKSEIEEFSLGAVIDRSSRRIVFMASTEGGVEIEKVAEETPEKILKASIDPLTGAQPYQARELAFQLGLNATQIKQFTKLF